MQMNMGGGMEELMRRVFPVLSRETPRALLFSYPTFTPLKGLRISWDWKWATIQVATLNREEKTITWRHARVPREEIAHFLMLLDELKVPVILKPLQVHGRDGSLHHLTIGCEGLTSWQWANSSTPDGWEPLDTLVAAMFSLAENANFTLENHYAFELLNEQEEGEMQGFWQLKRL